MMRVRVPFCRCQNRAPQRSNNISDESVDISNSGSTGGTIDSILMALTSNYCTMKGRGWDWD
jgi:hypothetical protein